MPRDLYGVIQLLACRVVRTHKGTDRPELEGRAGLVGPYHVSTPPSLFPSFYRGFSFPPPFAFSLLPFSSFSSIGIFQVLRSEPLLFSHSFLSLSLPHSMCSSTISLLPYSFVPPCFFFWLGKERVDMSEIKAGNISCEEAAPHSLPLLLLTVGRSGSGGGKGGKSIRMNFSSTQNTFPHVSREEKYIYFQFRTPR